MNKALPLVIKLHEHMCNRNINYCHFKSNEHLNAAVNGDTDLDLLFDYNQHEKVSEVLISLGFQKFKTVWFASYPFVEDYIAINRGKVVHVHAHFKLILGESKVKSYIFPWDEEILNSKIFSDEFGIYTSNPINEMLLLIVRTALKLPISPINYDKQSDVVDAKREFEWLRKRVLKKEIVYLASEKFGKEIITSIDKLYEENITFFNIKNFYFFSKIYIDEFRRYTYLHSKCIKIVRRFSQKFISINKRLHLFDLIRNHRTLRREGIVVSLIGSDGSGKSTQVKLIENILSKKMDTRYIYMGSGNGPASWHRDILNLVRRKKRKIINKHTVVSVTAKNSKDMRFGLKKIFYIIYAISLGFEKKTKLKKILHYKNKGMIVIADRYPQIQNYGYNDGPLLGEFLSSRNFFMKKLARLEFSLYEFSNFIKPDIVVKLIGDPKVLHKRREDDMSYELIVKKQKVIEELSFSSCTKVFKVDATLSEYEIKNFILDKIGEQMVTSKI
jgi:energy-coupling factor transporter ATP-binding protein EcfA2